MPFKEHRRLLIKDIEQHYLQRLLQETGGDIAAARAMARFSRFHLYNLMKMYALTGAFLSGLCKPNRSDGHEPQQ